MSGATWDMDTVGKVRNLMCDAAVSMEMPSGAHEAARLKAAEILKREAQTFAVDLCLGDVTFGITELPDFHAVRYRARWRPATREVELVGGASDGRILQVERVGDSMRAIKPPPTLTWVCPTDDALTTLEPNYETYELAGWREVERRWVYQVRG